MNMDRNTGQDAERRQLFWYGNVKSAENRLSRKISEFIKMLLNGKREDCHEETSTMTQEANY